MAKKLAVESSMITSFEYHKDEHVLLVEFNNGRVYAYEDIPAGLVTEILFADSLGKAFNELVKGGGFSYAEVD